MKSMKKSTRLKRVPGKQPRKGSKQSSRLIQPPDTFAPLAVSKSLMTGRPKFSSMTNGDCRIVHREMIEDIVSADVGDPSIFKFRGYAINPGNEIAFPWLSRIATNYESYKFNSLVYDYTPTCNTIQPGRVMIAVDYDARDHAPLSKQEASTYRGTVACAPWASMQFRADKPDLAKAKSHFVRQGIAPDNTDIRLYDVGTAFAITQGCDTSKSLGELWVEYDITLMTPATEHKIDPPDPPVPITQNRIKGGTIFTVGDPTFAFLFGDGKNADKVQTNALGLAVTDDGTDQYINFEGPDGLLPDIEYYCNLEVAGTGFDTLHVFIENPLVCTLLDGLTDINVGTNGQRSFALICTQACRIRMTASSSVEDPIDIDLARFWVASMPHDSYTLSP